MLESENGEHSEEQREALLAMSPIDALMASLRDKDQEFYNLPNGLGRFEDPGVPSDPA